MRTRGKRGHRIESLKRLTFPRQYIIFDCESRFHDDNDGNVVHELKLGVAVYRRRAYERHRDVEKWCTFRTAEQFWRFLIDNCDKSRSLWLLARNIAFDFTLIGGLKALIEHGYQPEFIHVKGHTVIIRCHGHGHKLVILDILNWFSEPLRKTGERLGLPKLQIDFETCSTEELEVYCKRDVEIELRNLEQWIDFLGSTELGPLGYTIASTAYKVFRYRFLRHEIYVPSIDYVCRLERDAYCGGRVEAYRIGQFRDSRYYYLDFNSLYPSVMVDRDYPVKYLGKIRDVEPADAISIVRNKLVVAKVTVNTDQPIYPVKQVKLIFPTGRFDTVLTTPELLYALEHRHVEKIHILLVYSGAPIFRDYVSELYDWRQTFKRAGNEAYSYLCKLLLNSLYGKFGQKATDYKLIGQTSADVTQSLEVYDVDERKIRRIIIVAGQVYELQGETESWDSFPAIAAHVTAYGRMKLWRAMSLAGFENVYYVDTDSLFVNQRGFERIQPLIDDSKLGYLKIEDMADEITINGVKDYEFGGLRKLKGIKKDAVKLSSDTYLQYHWPTFKSVLGEGLSYTYTVKRIRKHLNRQYDKGTVTADGRVLPLRFPQ